MLLLLFGVTTPCPEHKCGTGSRCSPRTQPEVLQTRKEVVSPKQHSPRQELMQLSKPFMLRDEFLQGNLVCN